MHEVWRALGLSQLRVEHLSSLIQEVAMRREIVVPVKHGMSALMLALKEAEIKVEAIPVHMHHGHIETQQLKDKNEKPTLRVHAGQINETTTLPLPTEEEWRKATSDNHDLIYIERILSIPEEKPIEPKELRNKGYVKYFQQGLLYLDNGLISYYETLNTARVKQLRLRVVSVKFRRVVISVCHVSPLEVHIHYQITLFRILARFWWPMINKDVAQFIRACVHCQLVS